MSDAAGAAASRDYIAESKSQKGKEKKRSQIHLLFSFPLASSRENMLLYNLIFLLKSVVVAVVVWSRALPPTLGVVHQVRFGRRPSLLFDPGLLPFLFFFFFPFVLFVAIHTRFGRAALRSFTNCPWRRQLATWASSSYNGQGQKEFLLL